MMLFTRPSVPNLSHPAPAATYLLAIVLLCAGAPALSAQHGAAASSGKPFVEVDLAQHLEIMRLKEASAPRILPTAGEAAAHNPNTILFTFRETAVHPGASFTDSTRQTSAETAMHVQRVSIAFAHEGFRVLHPMKKTNLPPKAEAPAAKETKLVWKEPEKPVGAPVFFLYWELEGELQHELMAHGRGLEYRLVVDGIWMADPLNPLNQRKLNGALVSYVDLSRAMPPEVVSPEIKQPETPSAATLVRLQPDRAAMSAAAGSKQARTVLLRWVGEPNQEVFVAGSFNQFDPYLNQLEPEGPDPRHPDKTVYAVRLRLLAGQYQYHFVINGRPRLDPLNVQYGYDSQGTRYSKFLVR
jgi:hypothetical protein